MPEGAPTSALGARSGAPSGLRPSSFVMCNTPVEVQFITSAGCLNYPCRTPSGPEDFHLRALPEPYVNLSIHTAPIVRPLPWHSDQWARSLGFARRNRSNQSLAPLV